MEDETESERDDTIVEETVDEIEDEIEQGVDTKDETEDESEDEIEQGVDNDHDYREGLYEPMNLYAAILQNDKIYVKKYIRNHGLLDVLAYEGALPALTLTLECHLDNSIAIMLIRAGANVQEKSIQEDGYSCTPLGMAIFKGKLKMVQEMVLMQGVNINLKEGKDKLTPLLQAVRRHPLNSRIAHHLLKFGADPLCRDRNGVTALGMAACWGDYSLVKKMCRNANFTTSTALQDIHGYNLLQQVGMMRTVIVDPETLKWFNRTFKFLARIIDGLPH